MLYAGGYADRLKARSIAMIIFAIFFVASLSMATFNEIWMLPIIIFFLRFCGQGMLSHLAMVFVGRWFSKNRGRVISIASLGFSLSEALLPILFVLLMSLIGWRNSWFLVAALIFFLSLLLSFLLRKERKSLLASDLSQLEGSGNPGMQGIHWTRIKMIKNWVFWAALPALLVQPIFSTTFFFQQVLYAETKNWTLESYVALIPIYTLASLMGLVLGGIIVDKYGTKRLLPFYLLPMATGFMISSYCKTLFEAAIAFMCVGLMQGLGAVVAGTFWPEFYGTKHLGSVRSVATSIMVFASALGPLSSGIFLDSGYGLETQYAMYSVLTFLSALGMLFVSRVSLTKV